MMTKSIEKSPGSNIFPWSPQNLTVYYNSIFEIIDSKLFDFC